MTDLNVHVRLMTRRDLPEALAIEHAGFAVPWSEDEFLAVLNERNCIGYAAGCGQWVVGFMVYELHRGHLRLLNLAVHPDYRRRGVGRQMVTKMLGKLHAERRTRITARVADDNLPAHLFLRSFGFLARGVVRAPFPGRDLDAYDFEYDLATAWVLD